MSGAPQGNKNALKYGLYAGRTAAELAELTEAPPLHALDEIRMLRSSPDKILALPGYVIKGFLRQYKTARLHYQTMRL